MSIWKWCFLMLVSVLATCHMMKLLIPMLLLCLCIPRLGLIRLSLELSDMVPNIFHLYLVFHHRLLLDGITHTHNPILYSSIGCNNASHSSLTLHRARICASELLISSAKNQSVINKKHLTWTSKEWRIGSFVCRTKQETINNEQKYN